MAQEHEEVVSKDKFEVGHVGNPEDPDVLIISFPVKFYAEQGADGFDMAMGKCRRMEAIVSTLIKNHNQMKASNKISRGVIGPDGKPLVIS